MYQINKMYFFVQGPLLYDKVDVQWNLSKQKPE